MRDEGTPADWGRLLARAIFGEGVRSVFQPIVDLQRCTVAGYEALTRFELDPRRSPDLWFAAAHRLGLRAQLEAGTLRSALAFRRSLPRNTFLTVNVEPESLTSPEVASVLRAQGSLGGLVLEITEHRPIEDPQKLQWALDEFRRLGAMVAIDDAGSGYSGLQQILILKPNILKLDRSLVAGLDTDEVKAALAEMIGIFANRIDAWLLAEGIETLGEALRCASLGVPLAQGYFFARPADPWAGIADGVVEKMRDAARLPRGAGLHPLVRPTPSVSVKYPDDARTLLAVGEDPHVVLIDEHRCPVGLYTVESMVTGVSVPALRVNVSTSPHELAHRLSTWSDRDTIVPAMVTDAEGRYLGTVSIQRLLASLGNRPTPGQQP